MASVTSSEIFNNYYTKTIGLYEAFQALEKTPPEPQRKKKVLILSPLGDTHTMGLLIPQLFLEKMGFKTKVIFQATPLDLLDAIDTFRPDVILITCLLQTGQQAIQHLITMLPHTFETPLLLGGFGITRSWIDSKILTTFKGPLYYAQRTPDAIFLITTLSQHAPLEAQGPTENVPTSITNLESTAISAYDSQIEDFSKHIETEISLTELWKNWVVPRSLYTLHFGYKGNFSKALDQKTPLALEMYTRVNQVKADCIKNKLLIPKAIWQWLHCISNGNTLTVWSETEPKLTMDFPRQAAKSSLCLADYISSKQPDVLGVIVCTVGDTHHHLLDLFQKEKYCEALVFHALSVQTAEALCEYIHFKMRKCEYHEEKMPNFDAIQVAHYSGKRYSYGYACCPDLSGQDSIFKLLSPEQIGINLSSLYMMTPEASVSALVFLHPEATYFSL